MVLQHCEGVMPWFVQGVSNIPETLIFFIVWGVRNCFAALRQGVAMVLLHGEGVLQYHSLGVLIAKESCNELVLRTARGGHNGSRLKSLKHV